MKVRENMIRKLKKYMAFGTITFMMLSESNCVKAYDWSIPPQFGISADFSEGFASCELYSYYIDYKKNVLYDYPINGARFGQPFSYDLALGATSSTGHNYKFYDKLGNSYDIDEGMEPSSFSDGLALFSKYINGRFYYGFLNKELKVCIEPIYELASDFEEGYAYVMQENDTLFGYINRFGEIVIEPQFEKALNFSEGMAAVKSPDGLWGYIDYKGNYIIQPKYTTARQFHDGYAVVSMEDKKGFIDINENFIEVKEIKEDLDYQYDFSEGVSVIKCHYDIADNGLSSTYRYGLINNKGEYILLPEYEYLSDCNEGTIIAVKDGKYFILNSSGNVLEEYKEAPLTPVDDITCKQYLSNSHENLISAAAERDDYIRWGYLKNPIAIPSDWAKDEIEASFINGIVPHSIAYNYQDKITRKEFCTLLVKMIERTLNSTIPIESMNVFEDTKDINILKLYYAGVIKGVDGNIFAPNDFITREQAARILMYAGVYMGVPYDKGNGNVYEDTDEISDWAKESVNLLYDNNIMSGTNNKFLPKENFTREQSIVSVYKLFKKF